VKILHVTPYFYGAWAYGGIPRLSYHLAAAQVALGHEVHAVTTDAIDRETRRPEKAYEVSGIRVRAYPNLSNRLAYDYQFFTPRKLGAERRFIEQYDMVHVHGHRNLHNHLVSFQAHANQIPFALQPNGTLVNIERRRFLKSVFDRLWGDKQVSAASALIAVAEAEKSQFIRLGVPGEKIRVFPNGVEMEVDAQGLSFKREFGIQGDYLLYLGKLTPRKGIERAISALALLEDQGLKLVVAGNDMGYAKQLRRLAGRLGLSERVIFTGLVTGPLKAAAYQEALYTIYAGRDEIFGLVPWESILCGTPVIVSDDSGCGEWVKRGGAGHLAPDGDPAAIARVVNRRDRELDLAMVEQGRKFCRERLDWRIIAQGMVEYYRELRSD